MDTAYNILKTLRTPATTYQIRNTFKGTNRTWLQSQLDALLQSGHIELEGVSQHITRKEASRLPYIYRRTPLGDLFIESYAKTRKLLRAYNLDAKRTL